jgi:hypothetical protein
MSAPYNSQSISNYNANPPPDDGSTGSNNEVDWAFVKEKIGDPIKTLSEAQNTESLSAFGKVIGGGGITSTAVDYAVQSSDQGKLIKATASSITITTPDATVVGAPFVFGVNNNSTGTITLDGSGSQNIDGNANLTIPAGGGALLNTDGTNWFTYGQQGTLVGKQLSYGDIINGTIVESNTSNAVTYSLKTLAGNNPSASDPVLVCFRNPTAGTGNYVYRNVAAATSLTITSGSTLGASNGVPFRIWLVLFDDAGTIRLGAIKLVSGQSIAAIGNKGVASSTAEGGAGGADSAQTFYTGTAVSSKSYVLLGYCDYASGLATAGTWNVSPGVIQLFGPGIALPGSVISTVYASTSTVTTTTGGPTVTNLTANITPSSAANIIEIQATGEMSVGVINAACSVVIKRGGSTDVTSTARMALASGAATITQHATQATMFGLDAPGSTSSQTYAAYITTTAGTLSFPESGVPASMILKELMV